MIPGRLPSIVAGLGLLALAIAIGPGGVAAQGVVSRASAAVLQESYSFDEGLGFEGLAEWSLPVVVGLEVGGRASLVVSSGWASVTASGSDGAEDVTVSGLLDTEARLTVEVIPRRLSLLVSGVVPTGVTEIAGEGAPLLGLVAAETLDFSVVRLGSGGGLGGGVVAAVPAGAFALGLAATVTGSREYTPVADGELYEPGSEVRVRVGVEGPLGRRSYLRVAGIVSRRGADRFAGEPQADPGARASLYAAVEQGVGRSTLSLYGFWSRRGAPSIEEGPVGLALLPESRTLVAGGRWSVPVRGSDRLTPRVEVRRSDAVPLDPAAPPAGEGELERLGTSVRVGADYRLRASSRTSVVLQADGLTGEIRGGGAGSTLLGVRGFRAGVRLEWRP